MEWKAMKAKWQKEECEANRCRKDGEECTSEHECGYGDGWYGWNCLQVGGNSNSKVCKLTCRKDHDSDCEIDIKEHKHGLKKCIWAGGKYQKLKYYGGELKPYEKTSVCS
jgi:hypothetical protein